MKKIMVKLITVILMVGIVATMTVGCGTNSTTSNGNESTTEATATATATASAATVSNTEQEPTEPVSDVPSEKVKITWFMAGDHNERWDAYINGEFKEKMLKRGAI